MATTTEMLLPQLVEIWLPSHDASQGSSTEQSEQLKTSQIPPLIRFINNLPDVCERDQKRKRLPCGHSVSLPWILQEGNFLGGTISKLGQNFLGCAEEGCHKWISCPTMLDPWALDGLETRLTLIQWSWNKHAPTEGDKITVSLLRDMLSKIGYLTQDPEPAPEAALEPELEGQLSSSTASESSLMQTLVDVEIAASNLKELYTETRAESPFDSGEPYCSYRAVIPHDPSTPYPIQSLGQHCQCIIPHEFEREPSEWGLGLTPSEMVSEPKEPKKEKRKTVRFVAPVVTEVQYFDKWFNDEYRDSGRYWSTGPHRKSTDPTTQAEDDLEIEKLEFPERFLGRRESVVGGPEGANWLSDDEDEGNGLVAEMEREMERAGEAVDDKLTWAEMWEDEETPDVDIVDEMKGAEGPQDEKALVGDKKVEGQKKDENDRIDGDAKELDDKMDEDEKALDEAQKGRELWDESWDESIEDLMKRHESWEDMF